MSLGLTPQGCFRLVGPCSGCCRTLLVTVFMLTPPSVISVITFSVVMGLLWLATVPPTSGLVARMFGTRYMSMLYGLVFLSHQVGSFSGVWLVAGCMIATAVMILFGGLALP